MSKFQIYEAANQFCHAGTKATSDISNIAEKQGFKRIIISVDTSEKSFFGKVKRQLGYFRDWNRVIHLIKKDDILFLQHPFHYKQITRNISLRILKFKKVKVISFVHDVEKLRRYRYNKYYQREFNEMIKMANVLIVHNTAMRQWFMNHGIDSSKLVTLDVFDYLQDYNKDKIIEFERSITIAGNLSAEKSSYINHLEDLENIKIHLYGPNYNKEFENRENIIYHGSFPADEIPQNLNRGFGLVWDGDSLDGCTGDSGQYLRYNNPHKLSLYLSSGIPVVIWRNAAEAGYVKKNGLGICVNSLLELSEKMSTIDKSTYNEMLKNVDVIRKSLCEGCQSRNAITRATRKLETREPEVI